jgi:UPF0271 protein
MPLFQPVTDLNCDLGEGFGAWTAGDDAALLDVVTSANIACGFHAGDPNTMRRVCQQAADNGVAIGAHVGYRDLAGFGRRPMTVAPEDLVNDVLYQIAALEGFARVAGTRVSYVKPHGALYNTVATDAEQAAAVVEAVHLYDPGLSLLGLPDSQSLAAAGAKGLTGVPEAFVDRAYDNRGGLVPRGVPGAVIHDAEAVVKRSLTMVWTGRVTAVDGSEVPLAPRSLCIHGDTPDAVDIARRVRHALITSGVVLAAFTKDRSLCAS